MNLFVENNWNLFIVFEALIWPTFFIYVFPRVIDNCCIRRDPIILYKFSFLNLDVKILIGNRPDTIFLKNKNFIRKEI
ncbi:hypothetical protein A6767_16510 [Aeromonas veronii]|nr:hypothetical protein A6767_16510 [Aeromonas veronii]